jgi:hypothetical protein
MLVASVNQRKSPMHSQLLNSFHHQNRYLEILTGQNCKITGVGVSGFAMLSVRVKPEHTRMHLKSESLQEKQLNNSTNLVDVSRTLLRIVARLPKTEYSEDKSNGYIRRQAAEDQLDDLPDPASASDTSQG